MRKTLLRAEPLELRMMLAGTPTMAAPVTVDLSTVATTGTAALAVLGADDGGEAALVYRWSATRLPSGATVTFSSNVSNDAKQTVASFNKAGTYTLTARITDANGNYVTSSRSVVVGQALTSIVVVQSATGAVASGDTPLSITAACDRYTVRAYDQFGKAYSGTQKLVWSASTLPDGAAAPGIAASSASAAITFKKAGAYGLTVSDTGAGGRVVTATVHVTALPVLAGFTMTPWSSTTLAVTGPTQQFTVQRIVDQFGNDLTVPPTLSWTTTAKPAGAASPTFAIDGSMTTVTFGTAGRYRVAATMTDSTTGRAVVKSVAVSVTMTPVLTGVTVTPGSGAVVTGTTQALAAAGLDQWGRAFTAAMTCTWSATSVPDGAASPSFSANGSTTARNTVATFSHAGAYELQVTATAGGHTATASIAVIVDQTLTSIVVSPGTAQLDPSAVQQFTAEARDQFGRAMDEQPVFDWAATAGTITDGGLLTAPGSNATLVVTASAGSASGTASVTVGSSFLGLSDAALASLVHSLDADGSISRADMIAILRSTGSDDGIVDSAELADLRTILNNASLLVMPDYVAVLAGDVVNGNPANAHYQGAALGNLAAGSGESQLTKLVDKWFLGTDHPDAGSYTYRQASGSLFVGGPSYADSHQGYLGDCYYISSLATIAKSNPTAISNMILDNGDGTWTVRFYAGSLDYAYLGNGMWDYGYQGTGWADYVTVDGMLPTNGSGTLVYSNLGANCANAANELWMPLVEKAYAQWNETGRTNRYSDAGVNAYANIEGGWMADVYNQVLGTDAIDGQMADAAKQAFINAITANKPVTVGTDSFSGTIYGLYGSHAYQVIGYNSSAGTFTLYNPWGTSHPGPLTWAQLTGTCGSFSVGDASATAPISGPAGPAARPGLSSAEAAALSAWFGNLGSSAAQQPLTPSGTQGASGWAGGISPELADAVLAMGA